MSEVPPEPSRPEDDAGGRAARQRLADTDPGDGATPWHRRLRDSALGNVLVLVAVAVVVLGGVWLVNTLRGDGGTSSVKLAFDADPVKLNEPAPNFTATTVDGKRISLENLRGRPVWLLFGATWCTNCQAEAPGFQAMHHTRGDDVAIVAVYVGEDAKTVSRYAKNEGLTYLQVADPDTRLGSKYRAGALPRHVLVGADGVVKRIDVGAVDRTTADARLDELLKR